MTTMERKNTRISLLVKHLHDMLVSVYISIKKFILIGIIIFLLLLGLIVLIYAYYHPEFNSFEILSGISTYAVALFTAIYAYLSSRQVEEIVKQRELQYQPLPWIVEIKPRIEKPKVFYALKNQLIFYSRYFFHFKLKNLGDHPAVNIDLSGTLLIYTEKGIKKCSSASIKVNALEEKQSYPDTESCSLMFNGDYSGDLIKSLLSEDIDKFPQLSLKLLYKNIIGGCFLITNLYTIYPLYNHKDCKMHEGILKNWIGLIRALPVQFEKELINPDGKFENCSFIPGSESQHDKYLKENLIGDDIKLEAVPILGKLNIQSITNYEYNKLLSDMYYGHRLFLKELDEEKNSAKGPDNNSGPKSEAKSKF